MARFYLENGEYQENGCRDEHEENGKDSLGDKGIEELLLHVQCFL